MHFHLVQSITLVVIVAKEVAGFGIRKNSEQNKLNNLKTMQNNQNESSLPQPIQVREDGKKLYVLDGYRIWADTYKDALESLARIQTF